MPTYAFINIEISDLKFLSSKIYDISFKEQNFVSFSGDQSSTLIFDQIEVYNVSQYCEEKFCPKESASFFKIENFGSMLITNALFSYLTMSNSLFLIIINNFIKTQTNMRLIL